VKTFQSLSKQLPSLIYAAKICMLPKLVSECRHYLSESLDVTNVIEILEQSSLLDDNELKNECLALLARNAKAVLTGIEIMTASMQSMETILEMDCIRVREIVLYETCLAWTKYQLQIHDSTKDPTDQDIREKLGDLLFKIRFPTMELTEFAEITEGKNVLTGEEKASVYYFLATKKKSSQLRFSTVRRRRGEEVFIERVVTCTHGPWNSVSKTDAINFTTNHGILLTGIGLYTGYSGVGYGVDVEILQSKESLFKKNLKVPSTGDANQLKVLIDVPISITSGVIYSVKAVSKADIGHYGQICQAVCTKENVTFTFSKHPASAYTSESRGQIPRLYFSY